MTVVVPFPALTPPPPLTVVLRPQFSIVASTGGMDVRVTAVDKPQKPDVRA